MLDFENMLSEGKYTYIDDNKYEYIYPSNSKMKIKFDIYGLEFYLEDCFVYSYSLNEKSKLAMLYDSIYKDINKSFSLMCKIAYILEGI